MKSFQKPKGFVNFIGKHVSLFGFLFGITPSVILFWMGRPNIATWLMLSLGVMSGIIGTLDWKKANVGWSALTILCVGCLEYGWFGLVLVTLYFVVTFFSMAVFDDFMPSKKP